MLDYQPLKRWPGTRRTYDRIAKAVCQECAVACGLLAYVDEGRIVDVQGDESHHISQGRLCARGTAFVSDLYSPARLANPLHRTSVGGDFLQSEAWETGLDVLADRLKRVRELHGSESLLIGCDPLAGLDFAYGATRFAELWGTPYVHDPLGRIPPGRSTFHSAAPCTDWVQSPCVLLVECDLAATHPVAFRYVMAAQRRGAKIVVADARFTATMSKADLALRILPGSGNALGMALMKILLEEHPDKAHGLTRGRTDAESWKSAYEQMPVSPLAERTGLSGDQIGALARRLVRLGSALVITGKGLQENPGHAVWETMAEAMGWISQTGCGWYPVDSGCAPLDAASDLRPEGTSDAIGTPDVASPVHELLASAACGKATPLKAVICTGDCLEDSFFSLRPTMDRIDVMGYFGSFLNSSAAECHVVLPAAHWAERDGLFFDNDQSIYWAERIVEAGTHCRSGLDFWAGLAARLGWRDQFPWHGDGELADHHTFYDRLLERSPATSACRGPLFSGLEGTHTVLTWPCGETMGQKGITQKTVLSPPRLPDDLSPQERAEREFFPLYLDAPRAAARPMTTGNVWPWDQNDSEAPVAQIHPDVAAALGIQNGDVVLIQGSLRVHEARAWLTRAVPTWMVYSLRPMGERHVLVCPKDKTSREVLAILQGVLR